MKGTLFLRFLLSILLLLGPFSNTGKGQIKTGASRTEEYINFLKGKKIGLVINSGSRIGNTLILDSLLHAGIQVKKIFAPEHGFRGHAEAGQSLANETDSTTGLPIISLYGKHIMPDSIDLAGLDLLIFDLQDVGVRFYTYISTLHYVMKACAHWGKPLWVLDRPNPNASFVQGPVLDTNFHSFVGMHPVPILYGMTIGEYARMLRGENWIHEKKTLRLEIIPLSHYRHELAYTLPQAPSPNLPNALSISLYPSLGLFEGTRISVGRGTNFPFQVFGSPYTSSGNFNFTPVSIPGKSNHPPYENIKCKGEDLRRLENPANPQGFGLNLKWILWAKAHYTGKEPFFNDFFNKLAGNDTLRKQIENGTPEKEIRFSWKAGLDHFKTIREKYLLYP